MEDNKENISSLIPISSNGLVRAGNSIQIANKLLATSNYEFYNDFKGELIWMHKSDESWLHNSGISSINIFGNTLIYNRRGFIAKSKTEEDHRSWKDISKIVKLELSSGNKIQEVYIEDEEIRPLCLIENNKTIIAGCRAGKILFIDTQSLKVTKQIKGHKDGKLSYDAEGVPEIGEDIRNIIPLPQKNGFAICNNNGFIKLFGGNDFQQINSFNTNDDYLLVQIFLDPTNEDIILSRGIGTLKSWELKSLELIKEVKLPEDDVFKITIDPKSNSIFVISSSEKKIEIFDLSVNKITKSIKTQLDTYCMAVSPDGNYLAIGEGAKVQVYETKNFNLLTEFIQPSEWEPNEENSVHFIIFSEDSKLIVCRTGSGYIYCFK